MLRILFIFLIYDCFAVPGAIREQAIKWFDVQKQLVDCEQELKIALKDQSKENMEFFKLQHQIAAIYQMQKRYRLGFGTAILPTTSAVREYLRKKNFLHLKTKEIIPIYRAAANNHQRMCSDAHVDKKIKSLQQLEALNVLHEKLFKESLQNNSRQLLAFDRSQRIGSISSLRKILQRTHLKISDQDWNWNNPVAGTSEVRDHSVFWHPIDNAIVLSPAVGVVTCVGEFEGKTAVCISNHSCDYVIMGIGKVLVTTGEHVQYKDPLGIYEQNMSDDLLQLRLYKEDVQIDPSPYRIEDM